jgi:hypothetical protein
VKRTLTVEEVGEIMEFTRRRPDMAMLMSQTADPDVVLQIIQEEKQREADDETPTI